MSEGPLKKSLVYNSIGAASIFSIQGNAGHPKSYVPIAFLLTQLFVLCALTVTQNTESARNCYPLAYTILPDNSDKLSHRELFRD